MEPAHESAVDELVGTEAQNHAQDDSCIVEGGQEFLEECSKKGGQEQQGAAEEVVGEDAKVVMKCDRSAGIGEARRLEIAERIKLANKYRGGDFASHFEDKDGKVRWIMLRSWSRLFLWLRL